MTWPFPTRPLPKFIEFKFIQLYIINYSILNSIGQWFVWFVLAGEYELCETAGCLRLMLGCCSCRSFRNPCRNCNESRRYNFVVFRHVEGTKHVKHVLFWHVFLTKETAQEALWQGGFPCLSLLEFEPSRGAEKIDTTCNPGGPKKRLIQATCGYLAMQSSGVFSMCNPGSCRILSGSSQPTSTISGLHTQPGALWWRWWLWGGNLWVSLWICIEATYLIWFGMEAEKLHGQKSWWSWHVSEAWIAWFPALQWGHQSRLGGE